MQFLYVFLMIVVLGLAFCLGASFFLPRHYTGRNLLKKFLKSEGYDLTTVPNDFIEDAVQFAEQSLVLYEVSGKSLVFINAEFVKALTSVVTALDLWRSNSDDPVFFKQGHYRTLFEGYDAKSFKKISF